MPSHTAYELILAAFGANLPFGAYRSTVRRLSLRWFLAIHLPIPAIFLLRVEAGYSYWFIPWLFVAAVSGQLLGGRALAAWRRRRAQHARSTPHRADPRATPAHAELRATPAQTPAALPARQPAGRTENPAQDDC
jgi:hypothetical protein